MDAIQSNDHAAAIEALDKKWQQELDIVNEEHTKKVFEKSLILMFCLFFVTMVYACDDFVSPFSFCINTHTSSISR